MKKMFFVFAITSLLSGSLGAMQQGIADEQQQDQVPLPEGVVPRAPADALAHQLAQVQVHGQHQRPPVTRPGDALRNGR